MNYKVGRKNFPFLGINKIRARKTPEILDSSILLSDECVAVDDDNVSTTPFMADKDILELVQSSKNIIDSDSKNEMNNAALAPTSFEKRNIMKSMFSYLDAHTDGEVNNKIDDIEQIVDNLMPKETMQTRAAIDLLKDRFGDRLISRFGPVNWPPRSCDLTPLDYFLWGYVKSLVYADKPQTLDHLEDNIRRVIADIRPQMLEKVIENWTSRLDYIRASHGSPMLEIIFKM
ncbi:putative transposable element [Trichonephila clavipes]|uniref:Putative transposable element n=1 Tax=Trichonephila clavipes TaxID=2585209 RepID=A0A8X6RQ17_TRICX|nr:putative transposable element [Trichonephila clavipes]